MQIFILNQFINFIDISYADMLLQAGNKRNLTHNASKIVR